MPTTLRARPLPPGTNIRRSLMLNQPQPVTRAKPKARPRVEPVVGPPRIIIREVPPAPRQSSVTPSGTSPYAVPWQGLKDLTFSGNRIVDVRDIVAYPDSPADLMHTEDGSPITAVRFLDPLGNPVAMGVEGLPGPPGPPGEDSTVPGPPGPPGEVPEAPLDGQQYARQSAAWSVVTPPDTTTDWSEITGKPATFPPSTHTHPQSEVTSLVSDLALKAPLASPALTGTPTAPTPSYPDNDTSIATTAYVTAALAAGASISVGTSPPGSPSANQLWWNTDASVGGGTLYIYYDSFWVPASPAAANQAVPPGAIMDYAGAVAPAGWLVCDGASITVAAYPNLHTAIGYAYGGSGANFNVPDLGGRVTAGKETTATRLTVAGAGIDGSVVGAAGGNETHTLTAAQMPSHTHNNSGGSALASVNTGTFVSYTDGGPVGNWLGYFASTNTAGSSGAHPNVQPTVVMNKIIKT